MEFELRGLVFGVLGAELRVQGVPFRVQGQGSELRVWGMESERACPPVSPPSLPALLGFASRSLGLGFEL